MTKGIIIMALFILSNEFDREKAKVRFEYLCTLEINFLADFLHGDTGLIPGQ